MGPTETVDFVNAVRAVLRLDPLPYEPLETDLFTLDGVHLLDQAGWQKRLKVTRNAVRWRRKRLEEHLVAGWDPRVAYRMASTKGAQRMNHHLVRKRRARLQEFMRAQP